MKTNSLYFNKNQRELLHKFIDFVYDFNMKTEGDSWGDFIQMEIHNEDEGTVVEFGQTYDECDGFKWIDTSHTVTPIGEEFLNIEEDQTYQVPNDEFLAPGFKTIRGSDILALKDIKKDE